MVILRAPTIPNSGKCQSQPEVIMFEGASHTLHFRRSRTNLPRDRSPCGSGSSFPCGFEPHPLRQGRLNQGLADHVRGGIGQPGKAVQQTQRV